jgi:hypothetical protein
MSSQNKDFTHEIAIDFSRALNLPNPNDQLANRVIQIATNDRSFEKFASGKKTTCFLSSSSFLSRVSSSYKPTIITYIFSL